jgi:hypothetical protein
LQAQALTPTLFQKCQQATKGTYTQPTPELDETKTTRGPSSKETMEESCMEIFELWLDDDSVKVLQASAISVENDRDEIYSCNGPSWALIQQKK